MKWQCPKISALLLFLLLALSSKAQISITPTAGCLPIGLVNANFNYAGPAATNVVWNFGDGSTPSNLNPTIHSYYTAGTYTVTFTALVAGSPVTFTKVVGVFPQPTGNFSFNVPSNRCIPTTVSFTGSASNPNVSFSWDFGDNSIGSGSSSTHVYNAAGSYTPILTVQDNNTGCFINLTSGSFLLSAPPTINLNSTGTFTCANTFTTVFTASNSVSGSPTGGSLFYNWNMGNGNTFSGATPGPQIYTPTGAYTVSLTVTDNNNCSASTTTMVSLVSPSVTVTVPATVCIGNQASTIPPAFMATVNSSQPNTTWQMGDGTTLIFPPLPASAQPGQAYSNTIHTYYTPGIKIVTITATAGSCVSSVTRQIMVEEITPEFTSTPPSFACTRTLVTQYVNQSTVNTSNALSSNWQVPSWSGANQQISTQTSPSFTLTQGSLNPYTIYTAYTPVVRLKITSAIGCTAVVTHVLDTIQRPTALFNVDKAQGCAPLTIVMSDSSFYFNQGLFTTVAPSYTNAITSFTWYSGAAASTSITGTVGPFPATYTSVPNYTYTYSAPGVYSPSLHIQTLNGCTSISMTRTITVVNPPVISYTLPPGPFCAGAPVSFTLASAPPGVQHWHVNTDLPGNGSPYGYFSSCVSNATPTGAFTHPGQQSFTISAYLNDCVSTVIGGPVTITGPLVKGWHKANCSSTVVDFFYGATDVSSVTIDYGEGPGQNPVQIPALASNTISHQYASPGNYLVRLRAYNTNGCAPFTQTMTVKVRNLNADFQVTPIICINTSPVVNGSASIGAQNGPKAYTWLFEGFAPEYSELPLHASSVTYTALGIYSATLLVKDDNFCVDTMIRSFRVSSPVPDFSFNANPLCLSAYPMQLTNQTAQLPDAVNLFRWDFGDLGLPPNQNTNFTTTAASSPTFAYALGAAQTKSFMVTMTATSVVGCIATISKVIVINNPFISMLATSIGTCIPGGPMGFQINAAATHSLYQFSFSNGSTVTATGFTTNATYNYAYQFTTTGIYTPTVKLIDNGGCAKTITLAPIFVQTPVAATFTFFNKFEPGNSTSDYCMPVTLSVTSTSDSTLFKPLVYNWHTGKPLTSWSSGFSSTSGASYTVPAVYSYSLETSTVPSGCKSSYSKQFTINDPQVDFIVTPDNSKEKYCLGDPISVQVTRASGLANGWTWDFGDGILRGPYTSTLFQGTQVYTNDFFPEQTNGQLRIQLVGRSNAEQCKSVKVKFVKVIRAKADFKRNLELSSADWIHCVGPEEVFTSSCSTNGGAMSYTWNLGDNFKSNLKDLKHTYLAAGIYPVALSVRESELGCSSTAIKSMTLHALPSASLSTAIPKACPDSLIQIDLQGASSATGALTGYLIPYTSSTLVIPQNTTVPVNVKSRKTTDYEFSVTDANGCNSPPKILTVMIIEPAPAVNTLTTVVIGASVQINAAAPNGSFSYVWTPQVFGLSDTLIANPIANSTTNITYSVLIQDEPLHCFVTQSTYSVIILPYTTIDVPTAFTPNGDGINDLIFPDGWGIRQLRFFRVYNRWGQLLFETTEYRKGWDGSYLGVPQNMESYLYQAEVETYLSSEPLLYKTGTFKLIR